MLKVAIYARVSTWDKDQNPDTQLLPLRRYCADNNIEIFKEYVDKARAVDYNKRYSWEEMHKDLRQRHFSVVLVTRLDRAFRDARDAHNYVHDWTERNIGFKCISQPEIDTTTAMGRFFLGFAAAYAEMETATISERVKQGMERAAEKGTKSGKPIGRAPLKIPLQKIVDALLDSKTVTGAAKKLDVSRAYIVKELKRAGMTSEGVINGSVQTAQNYDETLCRFSGVK